VLESLGHIVHHSHYQVTNPARTLPNRIQQLPLQPHGSYQPEPSVNALAGAERIHSTSWAFAASSSLNNLNDWGSIRAKGTDYDPLYPTISTE
jgi:hypothetical protein